MRLRCDVRLDRRRTDQHRAAGMLLHPLAQVGVRVLVPVLIGSRELMVDFQRSREGGQRDKDNRHDQGDCGRDNGASDGGGRRSDHRRRACNRTLYRCQSFHSIFKF